MSKVLFEYSIAHLLVSVATVTLQWQSQVAVSETVRPISSVQSLSHVRLCATP